MATVPRRADAAALGREARRRPVPVPAVVHVIRRHKAYIEECAERLRDYRIAVEFRHKCWMEARERRGDAVDSSGSATCRTCAWTCRRASTRACPPVAAATASDIAMVRFHGRSTAAWTVEEPRPPASASSTTTRRTSSQEWVPKIDALAKETRETHVLMNNCYRDFAVRNGHELGELLGLHLG